MTYASSCPNPPKTCRVLSDAELTAIWTAAEANDSFGAIIRLALLPAQRREKVATMRRCDLSLDSAWDVLAEDRQKVTGGALKRPPAAFAIIEAQPSIDDNTFVFAA